MLWLITGVSGFGGRVFSSFITVLMMSVNNVITERIEEVPGEDLAEYAGVLQ